VGPEGIRTCQCVFDQEKQRVPGSFVIAGRARRALSLRRCGASALPNQSQATVDNIPDNGGLVSGLNHGRPA